MQVTEYNKIYIIEEEISGAIRADLMQYSMILFRGNGEDDFTSFH